MMRAHIVYFLLFLFLVSCDSVRIPEVSSDDSKIEINHFDHSFFNMDSSHLLLSLDSLNLQFPEFFDSGQKRTALIKRYQDPKIRELFNAVDSVFSDTLALNKEITQSFKYFHHYFPAHDSLKVYTWVSNFESLSPITVSGNTLLIALDFYLGTNSRFYKSAPQYLKDGFDKRYLISDIMQLYFQSNLPFSKENTLLSSMLYYGKIHYLSSLMIPYQKSEIVLKYTPAKMQWCIANEGNVWAYFVENNLLFSSQHQNKQRFIEEAPFSKFYTEFDTQTPGRIGQWIGWRIIESYMKSHPEKSLTDLINEQDAQKILRESRYKPKQ
tara:strand:- start:3631 stop:4605 length:975 start_codon:yes stop_codon:yes gene_type:complete